MSQDISIELNDHVGLVTIHRPPANYFDRTLISAIAGAYDSLASDKARVVVLASEGKHFCAGANFAADDMNPNDRFAEVRRLYSAASQLFRTPLPVIAAVQGSAVGGGAGLACSADFRVASKKTRFHANFAALGFHQGFGLSESLPAIIGQQRALDMFYTARRVDGETAFAWGLADRLADEGKELTVALELATQIAQSAPLAVQSIKGTLRSRLAERVEAVLERELEEQQKLWQTADSREAIRANLAREIPVFHSR